jgi:hypothetical protein
VTTVNETKLTSFDIASMQLEICHLMELRAEADDEALIADYDESIRLAFDQLGDSAEQKLLALRAVTLRIEAELDTITSEISTLRKAKQSRLNAVARTKSFAAGLMRGLSETKGIKTLRQDGHSFWTVKDFKLVAPKDVAFWPDDWVRSKTVVEPDRAKARSELKAGVVPPDGFLWEPVEGIRWR